MLVVFAAIKQWPLPAAITMLQRTTMSGGVRLGVIVHHTDAEREYSYDRQSHFGRLDIALDAAAMNRWTVVDMKKDWKVIFRSTCVEIPS